MKPGQLYGYRAHSPFDPASGMCFDPAKVLGPYGRGVVVPKTYSRDAARHEGDNCATAIKSVVVDLSMYDWEGDNGRHPGPLFTRCTCVASRAIPARASRKKLAARMPV